MLISKSTISTYITLGISLRGRVKYEVLYKRTRITDVIKRMANGWEIKSRRKRLQGAKSREYNE